jgi:hypothetical protein
MGPNASGQWNCVFSYKKMERFLRFGAFTYFPGVPTMFHYLLQATRGDVDRGVWSLRPLNLLAKLEFVLPNCNYRLSKHKPLIVGSLQATVWTPGCEHHRHVARVSLER